MNKLQRAHETAWMKRNSKFEECVAQNESATKLLPCVHTTLTAAKKTI